MKQYVVEIEHRVTKAVVVVAESEQDAKAFAEQEADNGRLDFTQYEFGPTNHVCGIWPKGGDYYENFYKAEDYLESLPVIICKK